MTSDSTVPGATVGVTVTPGGVLHAPLALAAGVGGQAAAAAPTSSSSATSTEPSFSLALIATLIIICIEDIMPVKWEILEAMGEDAVRLRLAGGLYGEVGSNMYTEVKDWLDHKRVEREKHDAEARRQREDRAEIREENRDQFARSRAKRAEIVAWVSIGIAIIGLLISLSRG